MHLESKLYIYVFCKLIEKGRVEWSLSRDLVLAT